MTKDGTDGDGEKWRDLIQNLKAELRKLVELEVESVAKEGINYNFQVSGLRNCVGVVGAIYRDREVEKEGWGEFRNREFV